MRASELLLATEKEAPTDAEVVSHQLMLRAGMIRRLASGLYSWLPTGLKVLRKVERIVREEMDRAGAQEVFLPAVQPAELWQESGRWEQFGPELLRLRDRHDRDFCFGPTHEEVITDIVRREVRSYKQLPLNLYQIQTKFRDEVRPRFGVMRAREFIMKDAYSFDLDADGAGRSYDRMRSAYFRIFERTGLDFRVVSADSGSIGGSRSEEFHVLAESGEDAIAFSSDRSYAANVELAEAVAPSEPRGLPSQELTLVDTPGQHTIDELSEYLGVPSSRCLKTLLVEGSGGAAVALLLRGDHELNVVKAEKLDAVGHPLAFASPQRVRELTGADPGSIGPLGLTERGITVIADRAAASMSDFVCGANHDGKHATGVNWGRDLPQTATADIRNVCSGDPSPDGNGVLDIARGIEVGHVFYLGTKYSESMQATCLDEKGKAKPLEMGCYGIGVTRVVAAAIEQNHDERGIIWPTAIAPYHVALLPMNMHKSRRLRDAVEQLYADLRSARIEVLLDDRGARPGVMFAEMELIGIPHRLVLGERRLDEGVIEYKRRADGTEQMLPIGEVVEYLRSRIAAEIGDG